MSRALTDPNRRTTLIAKSDTDPSDIVEVTANPISGAINVEAVASVGTQYTSGDATPVSPVGTIGIFDDGGTIAHVSKLNPLPVEASIDPAGLATEAKQDSIITAINNIPGGGGVQYDEGDNIATTPTGTLSLVRTSGNLASPLSQPLTDTQLRATPVPVSGTVTANTGLTQPLTDTQLRATAVPVSLASVPSHAVTNAGTFAVQESGSALTALQLIDNIVSGSGANISQMNGVNVTMGNGASGTGVQRVTIASDSTGQIISNGPAAHDAAVSGNPLNIGAEARSTDQTAVASGDITRLQATLTGKLVTMPYAIPENALSGTGSATNTSDTAVIAAQGAGVRIYVTTIIISNSSSTDTEVNIKDGSTTLLTFPAPQKSGAVLALPTPLRLTANTALNFASLASVTTMKVSAVGYKGV